MALTQVDAGLLNSTAQYTGFKNRIINGRFDVWQRSVGPVTGSGYTTADRWNFPASFATQQVANDRDTSIPFALQVTADSTGYGQVVQRIEDVRSLSGGPATLSFWAKSPSAGAFRCEIGQIFGSGGSTAVYPLSNATQFNMAAANTWQFFTVTVDMPSVSGKTIGAGSYVQVQFGANSGIANRVMTYSEVQFEKGSTATSFDYRPYGTELALCERYFQKCDAWNGAANSTTAWLGIMSVRTSMRSSPSIGGTGVITVSDFSSADKDQSSFSAAVLANGGGGTSICAWLYNYTGLTTGKWYAGNRATNSNYITLSAEL